MSACECTYTKYIFDSLRLRILHTSYMYLVKILNFFFLSSINLFSELNKYNIFTKVNSVCFLEIFINENCLKSPSIVAKEKIDDIRRPKTGGGPPSAPLTQAEEALYQAMDTRPNIVGLVGSIDTDGNLNNVTYFRGRTLPE